MEYDLQVGMSYEFDLNLEHKDSAESYGSGSVLVYATPSMIAHMEKASMLTVQSNLPEGFTTVGTKVNIDHLSATPIGMKVHIKSILKEVDRKRLTFDVEVTDEREVVGKGTHERFIIETDKFMTRVNNK